MVVNNKIECEVGIIGASLAGSATALALSRRRPSSSIILIDSQQFPREKPCGEGLSNHGVGLLRALGIDPTALPHQPLDGYRICSGRQYSTVGGSAGSLAQRGAAGIAVRRTLLDEVLLARAAQQPGVQTMLGTAIRKCVQHSDHCELILSDGRRVICKSVVDASGARRVASSTSRGASLKHRYASNQHFSVPVHSSIRDVTIIVERGFELFITPVDEDSINVALLAGKSEFAKLCRPEGRRRIHSLIERHFDTTLVPQGEPLNTGPVGNWRRNAAEGRVFFVGDACEQLDPIGGMGMTHALRSGTLAADALASFFCGDLSLEEARTQYTRLRYEAVRPLRGFTRLTLIFLRQAAKTPLLPFLERTPLMTSVSGAVHSLGGPASFATALITLAGW